MPVSPSFVEHALDLLGGTGPVQARRMFGGYGIYARGVMFGLLDDDELFIKADDQSRQTFIDAGCRQWAWTGPHGPVPGGYWRPPDDAHEEPGAMAPWARLGLEAALRQKAAKAAKAARKRTGPSKRGKAKAGPAGKRRR